VADDRKSDQWAFLAEVIAFKYVLLAHLMLLQLVGDGTRGQSLAILWNSCLRAKRCEDHHGFDRGHERLSGVWEVRRVVKWVEEMSNHHVRALEVTLVWQGRKEKSTTASLTAGQSGRA